MSDPKFYDVGVMLNKNSVVKNLLDDVLIDLHNIEQSVADQDITANQIMSAISIIQHDVKEAIEELIVEDDAG